MYYEHNIVEKSLIQMFCYGSTVVANRKDRGALVFFLATQSPSVQSLNTVDKTHFFKLFKSSVNLQGGLKSFFPEII